MLFRSGLTGAAVFMLRRKHPEWPRPYRTWGYPVLPALFVVISGALVVLTLREQAWWRSLLGLGIIGLGVPAYLSFLIPDVRPYNWGRLHGLLMLSQGFAVPLLLFNLTGLFLGVPGMLTGLAFLFKLRLGLYLSYAWLAFSVLVSTASGLWILLGQGSYPTTPVEFSLAVGSAVFWALSIPYYRRRWKELR